MSEVELSIILVLSLFALLAMGVWIAWSLTAIGLIAMLLFTSVPVGQVLATTVWSNSTLWTLVALPLFIWMGEILMRTRLADQMFGAVAPWVRGIPGQLVHVNIVCSGIFAAVSGSSSATCATVGKLTIPELARRGYPEQLVVGTLASAGTLGLLIPPSIGLIVYGVVAEVSIARLFAAGFLPGIVLLLMLMTTLALVSLWRGDARITEDPPLPLAEKLRRVSGLAPVVALIGCVLGSIYSGLATPTEAAALGVVGSFGLAAWQRTLNWRSFVDGALGATRTSCMIGFITVCASFLSTAMGYTGIPRIFAAQISALGLDQVALIVVLTVFFTVLGCFLEGMSIIVLTGAIIMPLIREAGIDPVWFGIYLIVVIEISLITPPVGINLFVLQDLTGRSLPVIAKAAMPYFFTMLLFIAVLVAFPEIALVMPHLMFG